MALWRVCMADFWVHGGFLDVQMDSMMRGCVWGHLARLLFVGDQFLRIQSMEVTPSINPHSSVVVPNPHESVLVPNIHKQPNTSCEPLRASDWATHLLEPTIIGKFPIFR